MRRIGGGPVSLSPEMTSYLTTGHCPRCDAEILSADYIRRKLIALWSEANRLASVRYSDRPLRGTVSDSTARVVVPRGAQAQLQSKCEQEITAALGYAQTRHMQCLTCTQTWPVGQPPGSRALLGYGISPQLRLRPSSERRPGAWPAWDPPGPLPAPIRPLPALARPLPAQPAPRVDLTGCGVLRVQAEKQVETFLSKQSETYKNNSAAKVTKELSVTQSVTRSVTTDSSKLTASNGQAGITIFGFATIHGTVQRQLSEHYSVTTENTLAFSEKTTVEIRPYSTVEHIINWKIISIAGIAVLGRPAGPAAGLAQVPFDIPLRLTYSDEFRDVGPRGRKGG